jgi:competence ComEA-like helix-hairpin-helix protein
VGLKRIRQPRILLDLNSASVRELSLLPGIGPVLAKRIVQNRRRQGNFESVQALQRVYGIGPKTVTRAEVFCIVDEHELRLAYR